MSGTISPKPNEDYWFCYFVNQDRKTAECEHGKLLEIKPTKYKIKWDNNETELIQKNDVIKISTTEPDANLLNSGKGGGKKSRNLRKTKRSKKNKRKTNKRR
jgi:hypothetical protein